MKIPEVDNETIERVTYEMGGHIREIILSSGGHAPTFVLWNEEWEKGQTFCPPLLEDTDLSPAEIFHKSGHLFAMGQMPSIIVFTAVGIAAAGHTLLDTDETEILRDFGDGLGLIVLGAGDETDTCALMAPAETEESGRVISIGELTGILPDHLPVMLENEKLGLTPCQAAWDGMKCHMRNNAAMLN